jgi:hypothetical protein
VLLKKSDSRGGPGTPAPPGNYVSGLWPDTMSAVTNWKIRAKGAVSVTPAATGQS